MQNKRLRGFTLIELLVTLALTSVMITFSYLGFNYVQKLLFDFNDESSFIRSLNEIRTRTESLFEQSQLIERNEGGDYVFYLDSSQAKITIQENSIKVMRYSKEEEFMFEVKNCLSEMEKLDENITGKKLINRLEFDIYFKKQKFHLIFNKNYDAETKLKSALGYESD